jgi:hypothetical protein
VAGCVIALSGCGSSTGTGTSTPTSGAELTAAATSTCTTAAPDATDLQGSAESAPATAVVPHVEQANSGQFTFDVACERFGDCACDAALSEPLVTTITFTPDGVVFDNDDGSITYSREADGSFRLVLDEAEQKVATIVFTDTGFVFDMTIAGMPCSLQTYTRR